ncbi:hypothetical protein TNCV_4847171 [Trichonephila clavipes]|nr:hypothetical protein TNCV_4847171 [Trichonephila clavipes]
MLYKLRNYGYNDYLNILVYPDFCICGGDLHFAELFFFSQCIQIIHLFFKKIIKKRELIEINDDASYFL